MKQISTKQCFLLLRAVILCIFAFTASFVFAEMIAEGGQFKVHRFSVGSYYTNCYVIEDLKNKKCLVIDPGAKGAFLVKEIEALSCDVETVILSHAHEDHLGGLDEISEKWKCPVYLHKKDWSMAKTNGIEPSRELKESDPLEFGGVELGVIELAGHSPGSVGFLFAPSGPDKQKGKEQWVFSGDTVFADGIGRTWFPGDEDRMLEGIRDKILPLPDQTLIFPGHGPSAKLGGIRSGLSRFIERKLGN